MQSLQPLPARHDDAVPAMAFYDPDDCAEWDAVAVADLQRMLDTAQHLQQIDVRRQVERHAVEQDQARAAVCMMHAMPVGQLWRRLQDQVRAGYDTIDATAPAFQHPLYWAMVELLQRALTALEVHRELGASGADGLTQRQARDIQAVAHRAAQAATAAQVPHRVADLMVALKPVLVVPEWCR